MTTINVTAEHLTEGIPGDACACPVVLAVSDAFPGAEDVTVGDLYISMYHQRQSLLLPMPADVRVLIAAIDSRKPVEPFTFDLNYPAVAA